MFSSYDAVGIVACLLFFFRNRSSCFETFFICRLSLLEQRNCSAVRTSYVNFGRLVRPSYVNFRKFFRFCVRGQQITFVLSLLTFLWYVSGNSSSCRKKNFSESWGYSEWKWGIRYSPFGRSSVTPFSKTLHFHTT